MLRSLLVLLCATACGLSGERLAVAPPPPPEAAHDEGPGPATPRFLKGQLHLHSDASGDSATPAADVARWYAARGYDFIVFTDHNRVTELPHFASLLALPGVELTQNLPTCSPPPEPGMQCLLHVNALLVDPARADAASEVPRPTSDDRVDLFRHAMAVSEAMGGIAQLDHPNFHYAADAEQLTALADAGLGLFEVANEAWDSNNDGDDAHESTEQLWDRALTAGARLYATATDDAHHYDDAEAVAARGDAVFVGDKGFVMVRAAADAASIRDALRRGDFYASTGVLLDDVRFVDGTLAVDVSEASGPTEITFIAEGGTVVATSTERHARFVTRGTPHRYVRAVVAGADGARAWIQPVFPTPIP